MTAPPLRLETLTGAALAAVLPSLAGLRRRCLAAWPLLCDAATEGDAGPLAPLAASPGTALVVAFDGTTPVGLAGCQPLAEAAAPIQAAFTRRGIDPGDICFFDESLLLPDYHGRGARLGFLSQREALAKSRGLRAAAFAAVVRNARDPRRPADDLPLEGFWHGRGYRLRPGIACVLTYSEIGDDRPTPHSFGFWLKDAL